ncbi:hypothetical protein EJ110_NYTH49308 [Nymphaea thermarum]|nr:hypothetical protein EJ110_NYTH49308 [Nymphaea thermarum]
MQEFDLRYAFPLGFFSAAVNLGISGGVILPWGKGFMKLPSPLPERFFIGGNSSPVCTLNGPTSLLGFRCRGLGPTDVRRVCTDSSNKEVSNASGRDVLGGDLAVAAFADLSFDLPLKLFRDSGIHGHLFASAGNLTKLTENEFKNFSLRKFWESFRTSIGGGIIIPTKLLRVEVCLFIFQLSLDFRDFCEVFFMEYLLLVMLTYYLFQDLYKFGQPAFLRNEITKLNDSKSNSRSKPLYNVEDLLPWPSPTQLVSIT